MKKIKNESSKSFLKKILIKFARKLNLEIIDQSNLNVISLNKNVKEDLNIFNKKLIKIPTGQLIVERKIKQLDIIFRTCTNVLIYEQNKQRIFEEPKSEYSLRSLNSLIKSIKKSNDKFHNLNIKLTIIDDSSDTEILNKFKIVCEKNLIQFKIIALDKILFKNLIDPGVTAKSFSNLASLYQCFLTTRDEAKDLIYFVEDDYLHSENTIEEMIYTYQKISSQTKREIFLCPSDYPYLYSDLQTTKLFLGNNYHWQLVDQTLCTFLTSKMMFEEYYENFIAIANKRNQPFEKPLHDIYSKELCLSPIPTLAIHCANINSIFGISPNFDWQKLWDQSKID